MVNLLLKIEKLSNFDNILDTGDMQNALERINELVIKELSKTSKTSKTNDLEELFQKIKEDVMVDYGYDEDDMEDDSLKDEVNRESRNIFLRIFGGINY